MPRPRRTEGLQLPALADVDIERITAQCDRGRASPSRTRRAQPDDGDRRRHNPSIMLIPSCRERSRAKVQAGYTSGKR